MRKRHTAQSAPARRSLGEGGFLSLCIFLGLLVFFAGALLALFAMPTSRGIIHGRARSPNAQLHLPIAPSGAVQEAWVVRYNGPGNGDDEANAIAVDTSDNVYVTGYCWGSGTARDYTTIKYNSAGQQQWIARYNGPANDDDMATAIAIDSSGNVYVTGASLNPAGDLDYATVKYNSAGQEQWVARYSGPGGQFHVDSAVAIGVDASGNVYVTGTSDSTGTGLDYATIKYNSAGQEQWIVRGPGNGNDFASAIAVDGPGNVYVTGSSTGAGSLDFATVKYNSAGQEQWIARYNGSGNSNDIASAIALDTSGNVYVTGTSSESRYATVKYNSAGQEQWVASYPGTRAAAIAVDASMNVYVTGSSSSSCTNSDYTTIKYNAAGQDQWVVRYNGPGNDDDRANAIAVDGSGNVYVTGQSLDSNVHYFEYATVKYNSAGQQQWVDRYNGPGTGENYATAITVDNLGSAYVTGFSFGSGTDFDYATIKYVQTSAAVEAMETPGPTPTPTATASPTPTPIPCQVLQDFDGVTPPALPTGWAASNGSSPDGVFWQTSHSGLPSPPADSPPNAAWVNDPDATSDKYLYSPPIRIDPSKNSLLTFRNNYALENGRDGGVLEVSVDGGAFEDILATGASFLQGGYNGTIATQFCSTIADRQAWTGNSGGFITTSVDLSVGAILDHTIVLRWRMASDFSGVPGEGWRIDTIDLSCEGATPTPTPTTTPSAIPSATATSTPTATPTLTPTATPMLTPTPRIAPTARSRPTPAPRP